MSDRSHRAVALVAIIGAVLGFWMPPEHVHRPAAGHTGAAVIHRHLAAHAVPKGASLTQDDDDAAQVLDDVCTVPGTSPVLTPTFAVLQEQAPLALAGVRASVTPERNTSIHDPPRRATSLRAPPFQS